MRPSETSHPEGFVPGIAPFAHRPAQFNRSASAMPVKTWTVAHLATADTLLQAIRARDTGYRNLHSRKSDDGFRLHRENRYGVAQEYPGQRHRGSAAG